MSDKFDTDDPNSKRNEFINEHYPAIFLVCQRYAQAMIKRFPSLSVYDLVEYGMEGAIVGLDHVDFSNPGWQNFVKRCIYVAILRGIYDMTGNSKSRSKEETPVIFFSADQDELERLSDQEQLSNENVLEASEMQVDRCDILLFLDSIKGTKECLILDLLVHHYSLHQFIIRHGVTRYEICRAAAVLQRAYRMASDNIPFRHLLTELSPDDAAYVEFSSDSHEMVAANDDIPKDNDNKSVKSANSESEQAKDVLPQSIPDDVHAEQTKMDQVDESPTTPPDDSSPEKPIV